MNVRLTIVASLLLLAACKPGIAPPTFKVGTDRTLQSAGIGMDEVESVYRREFEIGVGMHGGKLAPAGKTDGAWAVALELKRCKVGYDGPSDIAFHGVATLADKTPIEFDCGTTATFPLTAGADTGEWQLVGMAVRECGGEFVTQLKK